VDDWQGHDQVKPRGKPKGYKGVYERRMVERPQPGDRLRTRNLLKVDVLVWVVWTTVSLMGKVEKQLRPSNAEEAANAV